MKFFVVFSLCFCIYSSAIAQKDTLKKADLVAAATLADVSFTSSEIDSMYDGVKETWAEIKKMHALPIPNQLPNSLVQYPQLPGYNLVQNLSVQIPLKWNLPTSLALPADINDLAFYSIPQLATLIKSKKISSLQLTKFIIDRLKKYGDTLQCVINLTEEIAFQEAKAADSLLAKGVYLGPLHGIPYGLKDLFSVKNTKTTWGAAPFKNQEIDANAAVYEKLKKAGAVLVAKLTMGALALGDRWYGGRTKNPWNMTRGSSGSSAGSASATAAGLVPFAIGTETWGSIISPSTTCGATGLRPTFGSVSRFGAMTLSWSLDKVGPICRSAEDAAIVFSAIHGADDRDAASVTQPFNYTGVADFKTLKIGYAKNYFDKIDTSRNDWKALEAFKKMGAKLIPMNFPDSGIYNFNIMDVVISAECAAAFDEMTRSNLDDELTAQGKNDWPNQFRMARMITAVDYINANRHRYALMKAVNAEMMKYDVVICPTFGSGSQSAITNLTGHPAVCVPTGFDARWNSPTSITLLGNLYKEATILAVAKAFQLATTWEDTHPPFFK